MAGDLYTNLILNDSRFVAGWKKAIATTEQSLRVMGGAANLAGKAMKFGGAAMLLQNIAANMNELQAVQMRIATGAASFRDEWEQNQHALVQAAAQVPFLGQAIQDFWYNFSDGPTKEMKANAARDLQAIMRGIREETAMLREKNEYKRQMLAIDKEDQQLVDKINAATASRDGKAQREIAEARAMLNIKRQDVKIAQEKAEAIERAAKAQAEMDVAIAKQKALKDKDDSSFDFGARIYAEETALMRARGENAQASRREIYLEEERMMRDVQDDETLKGNNAEINRRLAEITRITDAKLAAVKDDEVTTVNPFDRSVVGSGLSPTTMGQLFGPGLNTAQDAAKKQAEAAAKQTQETKKQTEVLQQIARNTSRGLRYG